MSFCVLPQPVLKRGAHPNGKESFTMFTNGQRHMWCSERYDSDDNNTSLYKFSQAGIVQSVE
jgi:hypothetical protein